MGEGANQEFERAGRLTCQTKIANNGPCENREQCVSGRCQNNHCVSADWCAADADCPSTKRCQQREGENDKRCLKKFLQVCLNADECELNSVCEDWGEGLKCYKTAVCQQPAQQNQQPQAQAEQQQRRGPPAFVIPQGKTPACGRDGNNDGVLCDSNAPFYEHCGTCAADCGVCPDQISDADQDNVPDNQEIGCENATDCDGDEVQDYYDVCARTNSNPQQPQFTVSEGEVTALGCLTGDVASSVLNGVRPDGCFNTKDVTFQLGAFDVASANPEACKIG